MALHRTEADGTEGTATAEITYHKGKKTERLYGCIVKNDNNLKHFLGDHLNDKEVLKNAKYFFYAYDPDFKEQSDMETTVTCYRYSKPKPKSCQSHLVIKVQEHIFLPCTSQDFNDSNFLKENSKAILVAQDLNTEDALYGLSYEKGKNSPIFLPLKLNVRHQSSNVYSVDAQDHKNCEKLDASPVLKVEGTGTGKKEIVVGGLLRKESNEVSIFVFGKNQDSMAKGNSEDVVQVEPHSQTNNEKSDTPGGQPQPQNVTYNYNLTFLGNQEIVTVGNKNTASLNKLIEEKKWENDDRHADQNPPNPPANDVDDETVNNNVVEDQNPAANDVVDETVNTNVVEDQNPAADDVVDETVNTNVVEDQNPPAVDVGDETVNTNVVEDQNPPADDVGDETVNTNVVEDQNDAAVAGDGPDGSLAVFQPDEACRKIISKIEGQDDINKIDCSSFVEALVVYLELDRTSIETPPQPIMKNCRKLCHYLKQQGRLDIFDALRISLPNGMTGPRLDHKEVFRELPVKIRQSLTKAMTGSDELLENLVTELLRESSSQINFYKRMGNPAEKILEYYCQKRRLLVGELYDIRQH